MTTPAPALPRRLSRSLTALLAIAGLAATFAILSPATSPAEAVFSGSTGKTSCSGVNMGHTKYPTIYYDSLSTKMDAAQDWVRSNVINETDLTSSLVSDETGNTSIVLHDDRYTTYCGFDWYNELDGGILGVTTCELTYSSGDCRKHHIRYSTIYTEEATTSQRRGLACHESGHAFGLMHATSSSTCMKYGVENPAQKWDSTEISQINANY